MSARLTIVKNPFISEKDRYVGYFPYKTIGEARAWLDGQEVNITVEGWMVTDDYEPKTGEMVVITPVVGGGGGGKSIFGIVAMIALVAVTQGMAAGGLFGLKAGSALAFGIAAATMTIGGTLISAAMSRSSAADFGSYDYETNATYTWGDPQTMEGQNNAIAVTYGKVLSAGQTIGKYVSLDGDKEVLNWLVSAGEGEVNITDIKLNNNPIAYYTSITAETRSGTNDQAIISNFNDTYFTDQISALLSGTTPVTRQTQGTATEGLVFKISCENGLFYSNDDGSLGNAWVKVKLEYKLRTAANYTTWRTVTITGNQSNALRKEYRLDNLPAGAYDIRVTCTERSHSETSSRASVKVWLYSASSIVYDDFSYPGIALIGIKGIATDQLSGSPTISFIKERSIIWAYNPTSGAYEQKEADNPAWACYDMLHQARKLKNIHTNNYEFYVRGVDKDRIMYAQFAEWAAWCDTMDLHVNIELVETGEMLDMINSKIACIGRGLVIRFGTRYGCKWNHVQTPVQLFGMGNILKDSFSESFLPIDDRANAVEVTFMDADRDYARRTITIFGDTYNTDAAPKTAQCTYDGITDYEQAYREGKYQLACNKYLLRTVSFEANVDSIACTVGDVIIVSHDIIKAAYSGRISAVDGTAVTLPTVDTVDTTKSYKLMFRSSQYDTLEDVTCTLAYVNGELVATMTQVPAHAPAVNDIYDLALVSTGRRMYTVNSITRSSDFTRKIEALEYNAGVYSEDYDIPEIEYTAPTSTAQNVTGLSCKQTAYIKADGTAGSILSCSWNIAQGGGSYTVMVSTDGVNWTIAHNRINTLNCLIDVQPFTTYWVKVVTVLGITQSSGTVAYPVAPGSEVVPPNCTNLIAYNKYRELADGVVRYDVVIEWTPPTFNGYKRAQVWYKTSSTQAKNIGTVTPGQTASEIGYTTNWLCAGVGYNSVVIPDAIIGDTYKIAVCTENIYGDAVNPGSSPQVTILVAGRTEIPDTPNNARVLLSDVFTVKWDEVRNADIKYYEVRKDNNVGLENANLLGRTTDVVFSTNAVTARTGTIYVFAVSAYDKPSAPAMVVYNFPAPSAPTLTANAQFQGISMGVPSIPNNCIGVHFFVDGTKDFDVKTTSTSYYYPCDVDVYVVTAKYYDYFGDGATSNTATATVTAKISSDLLDSEAVTVESLSQQVKDSITQSGVDTANVAVKGLLDSGSALVMSGGSLALVASNGQTLTGLFVNENGVMRLQGDYIHITGNAVIDNNLITGGMIQAGAIDAGKLSTSLITLTNNQGLNGGAVTLNANGLNCALTNGSKVQFNSNGMSFMDSNGTVFSQLARFKSGSCNHGDYINLGWDVTPSAVLIFPYSVQTMVPGYTSVDLFIRAYATEVTSAGFRANVFTALGSQTFSDCTWSAISTLSVGVLPDHTVANYYTDWSTVSGILTGETEIDFNVGVNLKMSGGRDDAWMKYAMFLEVQQSIDGGTTWTQILYRQVYSGSKENPVDDNYYPDVSFSITANAQVRFRYKWEIYDTWDHDTPTYYTTHYVSHSANSSIKARVGSETPLATGTAHYLALG